MNEILKLISGALPLLTSSDAGQRRRSLRMFRKHRKKLYKELKKDGFTEEEKAILAKVDNAYIEAMISLNKF